MRPRPAEVVVFAVALTVFGLVAFALVWSGDWAYAGLAEATGNVSTTFVRSGGAGDSLSVPMSLDALRDWHRRWASYVVGLSPDPPIAGPGGPLFTPEEVGHMADVRTVFRGAEITGALAALVVVVQLVVAARRGVAARLVRGGAAGAVAIVAVVGTAAALAFDALFLLFHRVFFPQGNFLFDPATSNLVRLYPDWYWQGVTAGIAVSLIAISLACAVAAHLSLRSPATTYTRAA